MIIQIIQTSNEEGDSSSSRSFKEMSLSRHDGKMIARISAKTKSVRMLKITIDTGFCATSDSEERITFMKEENIVLSI